MKQTILIYTALTMLSSLLLFAPPELACGEEAQTLSTDIESLIKLSKTSEPHRISRSLRVTPHGKLSIERGTQILVAPGASLQLEGPIEVFGEGEEPVRFLPLDPQKPWTGIRIEKSYFGTIEGLEIRGADIGLSFVEYVESARLQDCLFVGNRIGLRLDRNRNGHRVSNCEMAENAECGIVIDDATYELSHCSLLHNRRYGLLMEMQGNGRIKDSLISHNGIGIQSKLYETRLEISNSQIANNSLDNIVVNTPQEFRCRDNYWGTADPEKIARTIQDGTKKSGNGVVDFSDFLTAPPDNAGATLTYTPIKPPENKGNPPTDEPPQVLALSEDIEGVLVLRKAHKPHTILRSLKVTPQGKLSIERGTTILVTPAATLQLEGELEVFGEGDEPVQFWAGNNRIPWSGIRVECNHKGILEGLDIRGADIGIACTRNEHQIAIQSCILMGNRIGIQLEHSRQGYRINNCILIGNYESGLYVRSATYNLSHCSILNNRRTGILVDQQGHGDIDTTIISQNGTGVETMLHEAKLNLTDSHIFRNRMANIVVNTPEELRCRGNYWGTTNARLISASLYDGTKKPEVGIVDFTDYLMKPLEDIGSTLSLNPPGKKKKSP